MLDCKAIIMNVRFAKLTSKVVVITASIVLACALAPLSAFADDGSQEVESGWMEVRQATSGFYYGWLVNAVVTVTEGVVSDVRVDAVDDAGSELPEYKFKYYEPAHYYMEENIVEAHIMADNPDAVDDVDVVSGATHTSTTIKKAVKAALGVWAQNKEAAFEADLENATVVLAKNAFVYTGSAFRPAATVTSRNGNVLAAGIDYTLSYANNVNAGTATAIVEGIEGGAYTGAKSATFTIAPANQVVKAAKAMYSVKFAKVKKKGQTVAVKFSADGGGKVTVKKGAKKGTYTLKVKVTAAAKGNYAKTVATVPLKVKVA